MDSMSLREELNEKENKEDPLVDEKQELLEKFDETMVSPRNFTRKSLEEEDYILSIL